MTVARILGTKSGAEVVACSPQDSVEKIAQTLTQHRIGAVFIIDDAGKLAGIVSERDIVRMISSDGAGALEKTAGEVMSKNVVTCLPSDTVTMLMGLMTENRVRHIPVVVDNKIEGVVSIGDVVKARIAAAEREAAEMMQYISSGV